MAILHGNMSYTPSGRKKKPLPKASRGKYKPKWEPLVVQEPYRPDEPYYPSNISPGASTSPSDQRYNLNSNFVVGQAYNKGNLVVLTKDEAGDSRTGKRR